MHSLNPNTEPPAPDSDGVPEREPIEDGIPRRGTFKREVWNVVSTHGGGGIRTRDIAKILTKPFPNVRSALAGLEHDGLIVRIGVGTWDLS